MESNGVNWGKLCPQILIYYSTNIKNNAPKHFEMLRGKTSIWVSVFESGGFLLAFFISVCYNKS